MSKLEILPADEYKPLRETDLSAGLGAGMIGAAGGLAVYFATKYPSLNYAEEAMSAGLGGALLAYTGIMVSSISRYFSEGHYRVNKYIKNVETSDEPDFTGIARTAGQLNELLRLPAGPHSSHTQRHRF
jgi:hypothetical protein